MVERLQSSIIMCLLKQFDVLILTCSKGMFTLNCRLSDVCVETEFAVMIVGGRISSREIWSLNLTDTFFFTNFFYC